MITFDRLVDHLEQVHYYDRYVSALCPFHDDRNPSLLVFKDGWYRCLSCGAVGTHDMLWNRLNGRLYPSTTQTPAQFSIPKLPTVFSEIEALSNIAHSRLIENCGVLDWYLKWRKLDDRIDPQWLGWFKGWYTVPIYAQERDKLGDRKQIGIVVRADRAIQEATGRRYHMPKGQGQILYVPDWNLVERSDYLCVVFGIFDALALTHLRIPAASGTTGKAFDPTLLDFWRKKIIVIPDRGEEDEGIALAGSLDWRGHRLLLDYESSKLKDPADYVQFNKEADLISQIRSKV